MLYVIITVLPKLYGPILFFLSHIVDRLIWRDSFATPTPGTATSDPANGP